MELYSNVINSIFQKYNVLKCNRVRNLLYKSESKDEHFKTCIDSVLNCNRVRNLYKSESKDEHFKSCIDSVLKCNRVRNLYMSESKDEHFKTLMLFKVTSLKRPWTRLQYRVLQHHFQM